MTKTSILTLALSTPLWLAGCGDSAGEDHDEGTHTHADGTVHSNETQEPNPEADSAGTHTHADGTVHSNSDHDDKAAEPSEPLAPATIGEMKVELAQGHGPIKPGQESHLVVKLPYSDQGSTVVRAWIGGEDRTLSMVGKGTYSASSDRYDIHAVAPRILPQDTKWWIEIEKPDGTKLLGSSTPITE